MGLFGVVWRLRWIHKCIHTFFNDVTRKGSRRANYFANRLISQLNRCLTSIALAPSAIFNTAYVPRLRVEGLITVVVYAVCQTQSTIFNYWIQKASQTLTNCFSRLGKINTSGLIGFSSFTSFKPSEWLTSRFTSCERSCGVGNIG